MAHDFTSAPRIEPSYSKPQGNYLDMEPTPPFRYKFHPERWGIIDGDWLPILGTMRLVAGVNGVEEKNGHLNLTRAKVNLEINGWKLLDLDVYPDGGPSGYLAAYQGKKGPIHVSVFETPIGSGKNVAFRRDEKLYADFLRSLISEGYIPGPDPMVIEKLIENQKVLVGRIASKPTVKTSPIVEQELKNAQELLDAMLAAQAKGTVVVTVHSTPKTPKAKR